MSVAAEWMLDISAVEVAACLAGKTVGKSRLDLAMELHLDPRELMPILDKLIVGNLVAEENGFYFPTKMLIELKEELPKPDRVKGWKGLLGQRESYR